MANQTTRSGAKQVFDVKSPGFLYTVIVSLLAIFAASGVEFPDKPAELANDITTVLSSGGWYALVGIIVSSVLSPLYNAYKKGALSLKGIFGSTLTYVALFNIAFSALALIGFSLPEGTAENLVYAIFAKDWSALASILFGTILPAVVRLIKDKNTAG